MGSDVGRHVFGAAVLAFGVIGLFGHDFDTWQQLHSLWQTPLGAGVVCIAAVAEIAGGAAIQWRRSARQGAIAVGIVYLFFSLRWLPKILASPGSYEGWGNLFEQLSLVAGALVVYACAPCLSGPVPRLAQAGRYLYGICVISFTLEQLFYLDATASFVPKWIPPGQMFWAVLTTVAMGLGAVALLSGQLAVLASRLLTLMMVSFGVLIWLPRLFSNPHDQMNWGGNAQNLAITGAAWILSDFLARTATRRGAPAAHGIPAATPGTTATQHPRTGQ